MGESICNKPTSKSSATNFDAEVAAIRQAGIQPKCIRRPKHLCTPEQWAAHREYMRLRYADPRCRAMHIANQTKYLARKR